MNIAWSKVISLTQFAKGCLIVTFLVLLLIEDFNQQKVYFLNGSLHMIKNEICTFVQMVRNYNIVQLQEKAIGNISQTLKSVPTAHSCRSAQNLKIKRKLLPDMFGRGIRRRFDLTDFQSQVKYFINLEKKK